jgi:hypothetical protein
MQQIFKISKTIFLFTIIFVFSGRVTYCNVIKNNVFKVSVNTDISSQYFGAVTSCESLNGNKTQVLNRWFILKTGNHYASSKSIIQITDKIIELKMSDFGGIPLNCVYIYRIQDSVMTLDVKGWVERPSCFNQDLEFFCESGYRYFASSNQGLEPSEYDLSTVDSVHCHCDNQLSFYNSDGSFLLFIRNPFHSLWELNSHGRFRHSLKILQTLRPRGPDCYNADEGPAAGSCMTPADTFYRHIEFSTDDNSFIPLYLTENPFANEQSVMMYWDELPNRDNWAPLTTSDASDVRYSRYFIRLMEDHPKLKMGFLLLLDRMLERKKTAFDGWCVGSPYIFADSLDEYSGKYCAMMSAERNTTLTMYQDVLCAPDSKFTLNYRVKCESLKGIGAYSEVYGSSGNLLAQGEFFSGDRGWEQKSLVFISGNRDTSLRVYARIQESAGRAFFDDIELTSEGQYYNSIINGGFEKNVPFLMYSDRRRHFTDAHGPEHVYSKAPDRYLEFLQSIDNGKGSYGWEDRVRLGSHGYHHTPSLYEPDDNPPGWEFQYFDPKGDSLRLERIFTETEAIGLSDKTLKYWRSPGLKYTASLVDLLVRKGFVFMDPGEKKNAGPKENAEEYFTVFIQRESRRLWAVKQSCWLDVIPKDNLVETEKFLSRGHVAHFGGHPESIFPAPQEDNYIRIHSEVSRIEKLYPYMGYIFPDEYGDNANACYELTTENVAWDGSDLCMRFTGECREGNTFLFEGVCDKVELDGETVTPVVRNNMTYIVLPDMGTWQHRLILTNAQLTARSGFAKMAESIRFECRINSRNGSVFLNIGFPSVVELKVYDCQGKLILMEPARESHYNGTIQSGKLTAISSGLYIYALKVNGKSFRYKVSRY